MNTKVERYYTGDSRLRQLECEVSSLNAENDLLKGIGYDLRVRLQVILSRYRVTNNAPMTYTLSVTILSRYEIARIHLSH